MVAGYDYRTARRAHLFISSTWIDCERTAPCAGHVLLAGPGPKRCGGEPGGARRGPFSGDPAAADGNAWRRGIGRSRRSDRALFGRASGMVFFVPLPIIE